MSRRPRASKTEAMKKIKEILKSDNPMPAKPDTPQKVKGVVADAEIPVSLSTIFKKVQDAIKANAPEAEINSLIYTASLASIQDDMNRKASSYKVPVTQLPIISLRDNISEITYGKCCNSCTTGAVNSVTLHFKNYYPSTFKIDPYIVNTKMNGNIIRSK